MRTHKARNCLQYQKENISEKNPMKNRITIKKQSLIINRKIYKELLNLKIKKKRGNNCKKMEKLFKKATNRKRNRNLCKK